MGDFEETALEIASSFVGVLWPVGRLARSRDELEAVLADLGWPVAAGADLSGVQAAIDIGGDLERLREQIGELDMQDAASMLGAIAAIGQLADRVRGLVAGPSGMAGFPPPLDTEAFWDTFPPDVLQLLTVRALERNRPAIAALLGVIGVIDDALVPDAPPRAAYRRRAVDLEALGAFLSNPLEHLREQYGWGDGRTLELDRILNRLQALAALLGPTAVSHPREGAATRYWAPDAPVRPALRELTATLFQAYDEASLAELRLDAALLPIPAAGDTAGKPVGAALSLRTTAAAGFHHAVPIGPLSLAIDGGLRADGALVVELRPGEIEAHAEGAVTAVDAAVTVSRDVPLLLFGVPDGTRLELGSAALRVGVSGAPTDLELLASLNVNGLLFVLQPAAGDAFMQRLFGTQPQTVTADLEIAFSSRTGLRLAAGGALRVVVLVNLQLGPLRIDTVGVALDARSGAPVALDLAVSGGVALGPFAVSVSSIGARAKLASRSAGESSGSLGALDLTFGFKPPDGVGLAINTPAVSGGGFLLLDDAAGRYAGIFELTLLKTVSVKAIAIVTTKMPGGGFALLILITAEGFTPIRLGMGFALTGIGGLLALNRTVNADAVRGGLSSGVLDSVLFVKDPVRNANTILQTLETVFPIARDRLVVGPLAEITWGTPPLVKLRIALLLELPQPIRAVLLAALSVALPDEKKAVVELHVDAIGVLDLGRGELALDASLHHSRLLDFTLTGDMALRLNWGAEPAFLLSVGGFHPRFTPPRGLRPLKRLALTLSSGENPRVRLETYLAVTSNTIQMGARVELYAEAAGFGVDGGGSFDALIQWSPFALDIGFSAWVRVFSPAGTLLAISVSVNLTGPAPWHVTGTATVQLLFFSVTVGIDFRIGEAVEAAPVETVDVAGALWTEVGRRGNWEAVLPAAATPGATLVPGTAVAHPLATIGFKQRVVPLATPITRIGAAVPADGPRAYELDVTAPFGLVADPALELFAPAQYTDVPDDQRLSGASFVPMKAGVTLRPPAATSSGPRFASDLAVETLDVSDLDADAAPGAAVPA